MKFFCAPPISLPRRLAADTVGIALFERPPRAGVGSAGTGVIDRCRKLGLQPTSRAWDLTSIALSVVAADMGHSRSTSADGWTREFELTIAVHEPTLWAQQAALLQQALQFLTGDIWQLHFVAGGATPSAPRRLIAAPEQAVTLLSGGLDSLVGTIDRSAENVRLMAVSQIAAGDKSHQSEFTRAIGGGLRHLQVNHNAAPPTESERSQRSRSFVFVAFGALAATSLDSYRAGGTVSLFIPENGFISLNIPLTPLRVGSLSTRTTHPYYIKLVQELLNTVGLSVRLTNPYQFKTKGEMLSNCKDQDLLKRNAFDATSCGRFARFGFTHCGRCVPCLIRRASFYRWGRRDETKYHYKNLARQDSDHSGFDDVRAAAMAIERVKVSGLDRWIGSALNSGHLGDIRPYRDMAGRGLEELASYLKAARVL